ncbi:MAG: glycogen debranching protein [Flavobacteriaceae bacterium]
MLPKLNFLLFSLLLLGCQKPDKATFGQLMMDSPYIDGKPEYLNSPFVTAGNRAYLVGHQNGSFQELGWHIENEMGGIWDHPIKLMDGFQIELLWGDEVQALDDASTFTNYPFANRHSFEIKNKNLAVERWQFVPDDKEGLVVQLVMENLADTDQEFQLRFVGNADLRPTWLGERTQMVDHPDEGYFDGDIDAWVVKDGGNPWFVLYGADAPSIDHMPVPWDYSGKGLSTATTYDVSIAAHDTQVLNFVIAGSYRSKVAAMATYKDIKERYLHYFTEKRNRYQKLASISKLTVPDKTMQQTFEWLKYNCDWLVRTVPEIGTGITAGIPDYPWWFGVDSEYALKGYMAIGQRDVVYKTIRLLDSLSAATNGNGRIIHETSTNGAVFNPGNINETPQFASLIWEVYRWNGDIEFLKRYFPTIKKGLQWLMAENDANKNLFPDGFGMMEIHGLDSEMIDVAVYTQRAFDDASKMANELGDAVLASSYKNTADTLKDKINREFWSEAFNSYADFIGTDQQALKLIEDAIVRADTLNKPWAVEELTKTRAAILAQPSTTPRPFVLHHNWVVNTPMEMKIADADKAFKALKTAERFVNPFGVFVTGIDRDASAGSDEGSFKGSKVFSYTGAVMTLPTGVQAIAENNYGRPNEALNYLKRMARTFSYALPGSMYEVSPDYGMMAQAWNIYGFAVPIVQQFFGIAPHAAKKKVVITPQMPDAWDEASLENVIISDNAVSVFYRKANGLLTLKVVQENPSWEVLIVFPEQRAGVAYEVVESSVAPQIQDGQISFGAKAATIELILK